MCAGAGRRTIHSESCGGFPRGLEAFRVASLGPVWGPGVGAGPGAIRSYADIQYETTRQLRLRSAPERVDLLLSQSDMEFESSRPLRIGSEPDRYLDDRINLLLSGISLD